MIIPPGFARVQPVTFIESFTLDVHPPKASAAHKSYRFYLKHTYAEGPLELPMTTLQQIVFGHRKCGFPLWWIAEQLSITIKLGDAKKPYGIQKHVLIEALYDKIKTSPEIRTLRECWDVDSWPDDLKKRVHAMLEEGVPLDWVAARKIADIKCRFCDKALAWE
ncbi:hypothetical protein MMC15_001751 [Xylographa vitiligo]|nr:hypothetical protein [Xylographa vitiligo]